MMTFYKVCLTLIALASVGVTARSLLDDLTTDHQRSRRSSNDDEDKNEEQAGDSREDHSSLQAGYRFGDEFFYPAAASTKRITAEYEKNTDGCERIVKDTMICMLCKDPKTNSKYEQCSYVSRPKDRGYYTETNYKSPPANNRNNDRNVQREEEPREKENHDDTDDDNYSSRESFDESSSGRFENDDDRRETAATAPAASSFTETDKYIDDKSNEKDDNTDNCRRVEKNSKICTICKNRKTGADFERCSSGLKNYRSNDDEQNDKIYNYEKSDKYGRYQGNNEESGEIGESLSPSSLYRTIGYQQDETKENISNEKKRNDNGRKRNKKAGDANENKTKGCKQIQKESMTCTVCFDPETGGNFEKCSYTHQPNDKVYKFSKSKTFGYPENADDENENRR